MTFERFIGTGCAQFKFGEEMSRVIQKMDNPKISVLSKEYGSYAVYDYGVEYLFDDEKLCLVQYEVPRVKSLHFYQHKITSNTKIDDFKSYLDEVGVGYSEIKRDDQFILETNAGVKIYFSESDGLFKAAMKTW